jgi:putative ABC transport system permease protein
MSNLAQDLRIAFRNLLKYRGVSAFIALSIALAIAGNSTVFSIIGALLLRPFPYQDAARLVLLWDAPREQPQNQSPLSPANFVDLRAQARSFSALEAFSPWRFNLTGGDRPEEVQAIRTTPGGLRLLGCAPRLGRDFRPDEGLPGHDRVVLLADPLWQRRFGGDPKIVGKTIDLDDQSYTVIGVLAPDTEFLTVGAGLWVPLAIDPAKLSRTDRSWLVMGRVASGVPLNAAKEEVHRLGRQLAAAHPEANRGYESQALTLREQIPGPSDRMIFVLMQAVMALVLLIACANVANLLLARGQERQREIALRTTLGAARGQLVRQLLTESILLASLGGALGLLLSVWSIRFMAKSLAGSVPRNFLPQLDTPVLAFTAGIALVAGVLFGLYPAVAATRPNLAGALREGGRGAAGGRRQRRVIRALVAVEIAFALGALSATGLLVRSMVALQSLDPGFDGRNLLTLRLSLPERRYPGAEPTARFYGQVAQRLAALPGIQEVTAAGALPRLRDQPTLSFTIDGQTPPGGPPPQEIALSVLPNYFSLLRIPRISGRGFGAGDRAGSPPVALLSRAFARRYFPGQAPLGRRLTVDGRSREIVGIVADVVQNRIPGREGPSPILYLPEGQTGGRNLYLFLRAAPTAASPGRRTGTLEGLAEPIRAAVGELDPTLPVGGLASLEERIREELVGPRLIAGILGSFGLVALLLAALGIYGVLSYSVTQQTQEIGVRLAIGAQRGRVLADIARQGMILTGVGFLLGLPLVYLAIRGIQAALAGLVPFGATTVPAVALLLAVVAAFASLLPAQRASQLDPAIALRGE